MSGFFFILVFWLLFSAIYFLITWLVDSNEIYCYGKHAGQQPGHWTRTLGASLLGSFINLYCWLLSAAPPRGHVNVNGAPHSLPPLSSPHFPPPSVAAPSPPERLISNTCNECLNCHYHLLARVMFFGCHVSKYCEKISTPTSHSTSPSLRTSQRQRFTRECRPWGSFVPLDTKMWHISTFILPPLLCILKREFVCVCFSQMQQKWEQRENT